MFDGVLFDLGDTLVHFETWSARRFLQAGTRPAYDRLCEWGFSPPPFGAYHRAIGRSFLRSFVRSRLLRREVRLDEVFQHRHRAMGLPVDADQMRDLVSRCISPFRNLFEVDAGAIPMLSRLHCAGLKLGIVSNTMFPGYAVDEVLAHDGLLEWFPVRVYSSDIGYMKPHPRIFHSAMERLGLTPGRTLFVGDRISKDIKGASRLGLKTVLLRRDGRVRPWRKRPDFVVRSLSQIPPIVCGTVDPNQPGGDRADRSMPQQAAPGAVPVAGSV